MQKINESRCRPAEQTRTVWHARAEPGMTPESLCDPAAWANVARHMKPFDRIEVAAHDGRWLAEYLVWDAAPLWVKAELMHVGVRPGEESEPAVETNAEYDLALRGKHLWSVVRKADREVVKDGFRTKAEARGFADELSKKLAA
jgi:hypothetical protein